MRGRLVHLISSVLSLVCLLILISTSDCLSSSSTSPTHKKTTRPRIPILEYHDEWVCVNKPPGLTVHRSKSTPKHQSVLTSRVKRQLSRKVFPVHRLDHRTSGAMLLAFNSQQAGQLHESAIRHGTKNYIALVRGECKNMNQTTVEVDKPLKVKGNITKYAKTKFTLLATTASSSSSLSAIAMEERTGAGSSSGSHPGEKDEILIDEVDLRKKVGGACSLLLCEPIQTGRTRQIRRHLYHLGYPIIGDTQHGESRANRWFRKSPHNFNRLGLHCWKLEFHLLSPYLMKLDDHKDTTDNSSDQQEEPPRMVEGKRGGGAFCILAPLSAEFQHVLQTTNLWNEAIAKEPQLEMDPEYDLKGGSHGRNFRRDPKR